MSDNQFRRVKPELVSVFMKNGDDFELLQRLNADLKMASKLMGRDAARGLTDFYYQIQRFRITAANQIRQGEAGEPNKVLEWVFTSTRRLEDDINRALGVFAAEYTVGQWLQSLTGIGNVLSAGFLSHIDVT